MRLSSGTSRGMFLRSRNLSLTVIIALFQIDLMDEEIINSAKGVILQQKEKSSETKQIESLEQKLEDKISNLENKMDLILKLLQK